MKCNRHETFLFGVAKSNLNLNIQFIHSHFGIHEKSRSFHELFYVLFSMLVFEDCFSSSMPFLLPHVLSQNFTNGSVATWHLSF